MARWKGGRKKRDINICRGPWHFRATAPNHLCTADIHTNRPVFRPVVDTRARSGRRPVLSCWWCFEPSVVARGEQRSRGSNLPRRERRERGTS
ncbi:hypothetical protein VTH06DRAFT_5811 [Thermothelomyces fergusii]